MRGLARAGALHDELRAERARLAALEDGSRAPADDPARLAELATRADLARARPAGGGGLPKRSPARSATRDRRARIPGRLAPRRYGASGELEIWVGRSDEGNDFLTTRLASGLDLFFHVEDTPGSHVILRTGGRADPPAEALLDAWSSPSTSRSWRGGPRRRPRRSDQERAQAEGGEAGPRFRARRQVVRLRREQKRLRRVLEARIED